MPVTEDIHQGLAAFIYRKERKAISQSSQSSVSLWWVGDTYQSDNHPASESAMLLSIIRSLRAMSLS